MSHTDEDRDTDDPDQEVAVSELIQHLEELEETVDSTEERHGVRRAKQMAHELSDEDRFGEYIGKYTSRDIAEAFIGAVLFSIPLLVEDGVFDIAAHFLAFVVLGVPVFFVGNIAFVVLLTYGLIYWADLQRVEISRPLLGFVPRRLIGVLSVSFLTVLVMMTLWGRLDDWADPWVAVARITVVWTIAAFGAGLGDILPGESAGRDINDVLSER